MRNLKESMATKYIKSWITVLSLFAVLIVLWVLWEQFRSRSIQPPEAQLVCNPEPALAQAGPSVVSLWAVKKQGIDTHISVIGCGVIVDRGGFLLTSAPLTPDIQSLYVIDYKNNKYDASVITSDKLTSLTLLKASAGNTAGTEEFEPAQLADLSHIKRGDSIVAIGGKRTPSGWELTTKTGTITKRRQTLVVENAPGQEHLARTGKKTRYRDLVQTDISLDAENAGGPLVDLNGYVIALALPFVRPAGAPASFSYAISAAQAENFLSALPIPQWSQGPVEPVCTWLGAELLAANPVVAAQRTVPQRRGEIVNYIQNNSPAEHAGLRRGDVIVSIDGNRITDRAFFDKIAPQLCQSKKIKLTVLREGREKQLTVHAAKAVYFLPGSGSLAEVVLVLLIFALIYYLVYRNILDRVVLFVLGAIVIAVMGYHVGFYDQDRIASALLTKLDVLCFIVGMQLVTGVLDEAGALEYLAKRITIATGGDKWKVMWLFCLVTYCFSLVVNNLTTIMLMAPMVLKLSKYLNFDARPFLISMVIASNLGGASTMVGDFPNMIIGAEAGVPFYQFTSYMLPICLLELFVLLVYLRIAKPSLFKSSKSRVNSRPLEAAGPDEYDNCRVPDPDFDRLAGDSTDDQDRFFTNLKHSLPTTIKNPGALNRGLVILGIVIVGFLISDYLSCSPAIIALAGGVIALAASECEPFRLLEKVSIRDVLFFSGLFVLVGAAEAAGLLGYISDIIAHLSFGNLLVLCLLLMWAAALVTCFLNAGPTTALFLPVVMALKSAAPHNIYWWSLSLGVCAGSSGTLVGATAGSVTATLFDKFVKEQGRPLSAAEDDSQVPARLTFHEFAHLGLPIMLIFLVISSIYISVIYRW
ncbi:MAG TPA: SLC13 family permease [Sedimentisphaerales bacterium]|nr:SLC13 family permease [Sedimentisphaerales bacterium]